VDQAEFDRFAKQANLTEAQTEAIRDRLERFEENYPGVVSTEDPHLLESLVSHTRALVFAELTPEQIEIYNQALLPGSDAHPLSEQQTPDAGEGE
jgi:hypothetical protein